VLRVRSSQASPTISGAPGLLDVERPLAAQRQHDELR
jgi:hypothetical protein